MAEFYNLFSKYCHQRKDPHGFDRVRKTSQQILHLSSISLSLSCRCLFFLMALRATGAQTEGFLFRYPLLTFVFLYQVAALLFSIINTQNGPSGCLLVIITKFSDQFPFKTR